MDRSDTGFYADLPAFDRFEAVTDLARYTPLPDGWLVVIADIRGSTPAIAAGRYKDVNMVGASCITAALNVAGEVEIPYVFGGDGATIAVPPALADPVRAALLRTRRLSASAFGLELRVGAVPVAEVRRRGQDVLVGKYRISPGNHLAMFAGGGVDLADGLIKADTDGARGFAVAGPEPDGDPDLEGLSCRWQPFRSRRGAMISLLVRAQGTDREDTAAVYRRVLAELRGILSADGRTGHPIHADNMRFRWPSRRLAAEVALTTGQGPRWRRWRRVLFTSFVQYLLEKFDGKAGGYDAPRYRAELRANTDYRRFDDTLRLVLDCTAAEVAAIRALLDGLHGEGKVCYGLHEADSALMTCLVFNLEAGQHIHFVDGADGGFAMAAKGMKAQLAAAG
ncbi:MAG: DUF3095 domain-containing protein [Hyphomicrobiales bacterium]|nr:DUF3095 domain-containing protein [Hyphomicrobiales bacterium]MCP5373119.1 DUF3095 domain-containing protein [Hyphomicrobiales bacterium]